MACLVACDEPRYAGKVFAAPGSASGLPEPVTMGVPQKDSPVESRRVLVVVNTSSAASKEIGAYYAKKRKIPSGNVLPISVSTGEQCSMTEFQSAILAPIRKAVEANKNRIDYVVLTKGTPIRIDDLNGYSVDSQIVAMNLKFEPIPKTLGANSGRELNNLIARSQNPYLNASKRFDSRAFNMVLVTRLEGYTVAHCKQLVDRSLAAKPFRGTFFFDEAGNRRSGGYAQMQETLGLANRLVKAKGMVSEVETSDAFIAPKTPLMGYASWGSNDGKFDAAQYHALQFRAGAIAETFVSTSGRTFLPTSGGQSLIADLIAQGVTGVKGYVSEPYTFALANPAVIFDHYTAGFNLAESFYAASLVVKWKDIVIGDPLCNPYSKTAR